MNIGTFTGTLSLSGTNASSFQIVGNTLETVGTLSAGNYSIIITATQTSATNSPVSTSPLTITGSAGAPAFSSITLSNNSFIDNTAGATVGTIAVTMSNGAFTGTLSLSGANAANFQIVGTTLETVGALAAGTYSIVITGTQSGASNSPFSTSTLTLTGAAAPPPPLSFQSITLSNNTFVDTVNNATVGTIAVVMNGGTFSGTLALSGTNASSFRIVGTTLQTFGVLAAGTYSVIITGTQSGASNSPFSTLALAITGSASAAVATTWNPSDLAGMTLSNGNLTSTTSGTTQAGVRSTSAMPGVPSYFEITPSTTGSTEVIGIADSSWVETASTGLGGDNNGIGLLETGAVHLNNSAVGSAMPAWTVNTVIGVAVNPTTKKIFFTYNGTTWDATGSGDNPATNTGGYSWSTAVTGSYFIAYGALGSTVTPSVTGSQNSGGTQPVVSGPTAATLGTSTTLAITGFTLSDTNQPLGGTCALNAFCNTGIINMTLVTPGSATGMGTSSVSIADTFPNCQTDVASLTYTAGSSTGTDTLTVQLWDQLGLNNEINVTITIAAGSVGIKILNAGEQTFAYTVPSGYMAWDSFPPSPPANLTGAAGTTSVALSWTASNVGTAPVTYTVQDRITGSSVWATVTTGLTTTSYTVTGLTVRTSYDFQIIAVNALGNAVTPSFITVATTATGGVTGDASGVQASRVADFLETIGVNCFFNNQDGAPGYEDFPNTPTNAAIASGYVTGLNYLVANSGMGLTNRIYTDGTSTATENDQVNICTIINQSLPNIRWTSCWSWTNAATQTVVSGLINAGILAFAEGVNEPNPGGNTNEAVADCLTQQAFVWSTWNATQQVAAPSCVDNGSNTYEADYYGSSLATVAGECTRWNGHNYPNSQAPSNDIYRRTLMIGANIGFPASGVVTEFHPLLYNTSAAQSAGETISGYYLACAWLAGFTYYNVLALIWFDMFDYQYNAPTPPFPYPVGFFNQYNSSSPRNAAIVVHNFFLFCADAATTRHTFTAGKLNYTISGLPATWTGSSGGITSTKASGGGQSALFQGSNGTFYLFVWNEQNALALGTTTTVTVTFNSEAMTKVVDYSLTNPAGTANPSPIQTLTNVTTVTMHLTTEVRVLVITYP